MVVVWLVSGKSAKTNWRLSPGQVLRPQGVVTAKLTLANSTPSRYARRLWVPLADPVPVIGKTETVVAVPTGGDGIGSVGAVGDGFAVRRRRC